MNLTILNTTVRQDAEGRYCLNDCHRAAGGEKAKQPANFLRLDTTKALVAEISRSSDVRNDPVNVKQGGTEQGTYVCRELIYAYGEWISPAFHLTVIRAFDALVTNAQHAERPLTKEQKIAEAFLLLHEDHEKAKEEIAILTPKAAVHDRIANSIGRTNLREVGKVLQIGSQRGIEMLREIKWTYRDQAGRWHAYADKIDAGLLEVKFHTFTNTSGEERSTQQVFVTPKGMTRLAARLGQN